MKENQNAQIEEFLRHGTNLIAAMQIDRAATKRNSYPIDLSFAKATNDNATTTVQ